MTTETDEWALISYAHETDPLGQRYVQRGDDPLPKWAVDVQPHIKKETKPMFDLTQPNEIRRARQALGFTQSQLAAALELEGAWGKDTVRSWESGKRGITGPVRVAIRLLLEKAGIHERLGIAAKAIDTLRN